MDELSLLQKIAVWALPVIFAVTVHEVAHGWVASLCGDTTAKMLGRLTLNPLKHIDPIGSLLVPAIMVLLTPFVFGWAKPVPVSGNNLRHPRRDMVLVALAGPMANLLMAVLWATVMHLGSGFAGSSSWLAEPLIYMGVAGIYINVVLMLVNMVPIPPLDGSRVLAGLLPPRIAYKLSMIEPYGFMILVVLLMSGLLSQVLNPAIRLFFELFGLR